LRSECSLWQGADPVNVAILGEVRKPQETHRLKCDGRRAAIGQLVWTHKPGSRFAGMPQSVANRARRHPRVAARRVNSGNPSG